MWSANTKALLAMCVLITILADESGGTFKGYRRRRRSFESWNDGRNNYGAPSDYDVNAGSSSQSEEDDESDSAEFDSAPYIRAYQLGYDHGMEACRNGEGGANVLEDQERQNDGSDGGNFGEKVAPWGEFRPESSLSGGDNSGYSSYDQSRDYDDGRDEPRGGYGSGFTSYDQPRGGFGGGNGGSFGSGSGDYTTNPGFASDNRNSDGPSYTLGSGREAIVYF